jgi:hypothetical protein
MPPIPDMGLDALAIAPGYSIDDSELVDDVAPPERKILVFSTKEGFFSERLGVYISPGDILTTNGRIYRTNRELLRNFNPLSVSVIYGIPPLHNKCLLEMVNKKN